MDIPEYVPRIIKKKCIPTYSLLHSPPLYRSHVLMTVSLIVQDVGDLFLVYNGLYKGARSGSFVLTLPSVGCGHHFKYS